MEKPYASSPDRPSVDLDTSDPRHLTADSVSAERWTKSKMADFLRMLACTHSVSSAARSVGMSRQSAYKLRARLKGAPFDIAWETAFQHGYDALAHAALERALHGVEVPVFRGGEQVGSYRRYDERLTTFLLAARNKHGVQVLSRYGAAGEFWSERWDRLLERVETGSVDWEFEPSGNEDSRDEDELALARKFDEKHAPGATWRSGG